MCSQSRVVVELWRRVLPSPPPPFFLHLAEAQKGLLPQRGDLVVVQVEVVQVPEVPDGLGGDLRQLVLRHHQVAQGVALGRHRLRAQRLQPCVDEDAHAHKFRPKSTWHTFTNQRDRVLFLMTVHTNLLPPLLTSK